MEQYPAVKFMVNYGSKLAVVLGLCLPLSVLAGILTADWDWVWLAVAVMAGFAFWVVFFTFSELTQIIADMLLPQ